MSKFTALTLALILSSILMASSVYGQGLEDCKGALAMGRNECTTASIPYPDIRDAAERKQADVERWCKKEPRKCEGLETRKLKEKIEGIPNGIKSSEQDRDRLKSQRDAAPDNEKSSIDSKIRELDQKIDKLRAELDFSKKSLETDKSDADKRIYNGKYCVQARKDVNPPFRNAMAKAKEKAATADAALKSCLDELVVIWDRCEKEHEKDIQAAEDAITYCEKAKNGDL